jgi:hypothetical protein
MSAATILLKQHSQRNNLPQTHLGLYMFGIGLQRQGFDILSHLGTVISYVSLMRGKETLGPGNPKWHANTKETKSQPSGSVQVRKVTQDGPIKSLSSECRLIVKKLWKSGKFCGLIFDNINLVLKVAEQVLGHIGAFASNLAHMQSACSCVYAQILL